MASKRAASSKKTTHAILLALAIIALAAYGLATFAAPGDPSFCLLAASVLFLFASATYAVGLVQGLRSKERIAPDTV